MPLRGRIIYVLAASVLFARGVLALAYPLSPEQVREAYSVGGDVEHRQDFFKTYIHFPAPRDAGPDVKLIEFRTPYEQVALSSQENWSNYTPLDAERDYAAHPDRVIVRFFICGSQSFTFPQPPLTPVGAQPAPWRDEDYLRGFEFRVSQNHPIKPENLTARRAQMGCPQSDAVEVFLYFHARQFEDTSTQIQVVAPGGQAFSTTFDLDQLK